MTFRTALVPALLGATLLSAPVLAQDTGGAAAPAAPAPGAPAAGTTVAATYRDWQIICAPASDSQPEQCEMYQLLHDAQNSPIAEISIAALPLGAEFAAGATVTTPLETFLPTGMGFWIGPMPADNQIRVEPFRVCTVVGCVVRMGLSSDEIDQMKAGSGATVMIAPFVAVNQPVQIGISLAGFTAAYDDLQTRLAAAAAAARSNP